MSEQEKTMPQNDKMAEKRINDLIPGRLAEVRIRAGITQQIMGDYAGKSKNSISQYERGARKPDPATLYAYVKRCGVSADYLIGALDAPAPYTGESAEQQHEFTLAMQGNSMTTLRIYHGDQLTLCASRKPRNGDLVLVRHEDRERIMVYLEQDGQCHFCDDTHGLHILPGDPEKILAVVVKATIKPGIARK